MTRLKGAFQKLSQAAKFESKSGNLLQAAKFEPKSGNLLRVWHEPAPRNLHTQWVDAAVKYSEFFTPYPLAMNDLQHSS